jgi:hypothetical protein
METAKEFVEKMRFYGHLISNFLLPDQREILAKNIESYATKKSIEVLKEIEMDIDLETRYFVQSKISELEEQLKP